MHTLYEQFSAKQSKTVFFFFLQKKEKCSVYLRAFFGSPHEDVNMYKCPGVCVYMGHVHVSISMSVSVKNDIFTYGTLRSGHCSTIHSIFFCLFSHSSLMIVALFAIPFVECAITQCNMHVVAYMHHQLASVFCHRKWTGCCCIFVALTYFLSFSRFILAWNNLFQFILCRTFYAIEIKLFGNRIDMIFSCTQKFVGLCNAMQLVHKCKCGYAKAYLSPIFHLIRLPFRYSSNDCPFYRSFLFTTISLSISSCWIHWTHYKRFRIPNIFVWPP